MFTVYVLYSKVHKVAYKGMTSDFEKRFASHQLLSKKDWTTRYRPWEILFTEEYETKKEAMNRERFLKLGKGRELIKKVIQEKYSH